MASLETPTLIEQFVQIIPLEYSVAALVWTIVLSPLGGIISGFLDTGQVIYYFTVANLYNSISLTITLYYLFFVSRYLRLKILRAEQQVLPIMPGGEAEYHEAFRRFTSKIPVLVLTIPFLTPIPGAIPLRPSFQSPFYLLQFVIIALGLSNFVWEYSVSSWGLHRLGESQLKLRSFLEDRMMGARPMGNTALSATVAYLGGLLFLWFLGTSNPNVNGLFFDVAVFLLVALGVVMFFLPLNSLHRKMQAEKSRYQKELSLKLLALTEARPPEHDDQPSSSKSENAIAQLLRMQELEFLDLKLATTPTWPFDVQLLAKLVTVVLSVTAALAARIIANLAKF